MRKLNCILIAVLLLFCFHTTWAQGPKMKGLTGGVSNGIMRIFTDGGKTVRPISGKPTVEGQPYISDVWLKGKVLFANGFVRYTDRLNYDALDNMLIMYENDTEFEFSAPVKSFFLYEEDKTREFWMVKGGFYEVLHSDKVIMLKKHKKDITLESKYGSVWANGKIMSQNQLYFLDPDYNLVKVVRGNDVIKSFPETQKELRSFAKEAKLNLRTEEDLIKLLQYQASLN